MAVSNPEGQRKSQGFAGFFIGAASAMTLRETEIAARRRIARSKRNKPPRDLDAERERRRQQAERAQAERDRAFDDQRVMTIGQWAVVNNFSLWTGKRLIKAGKGPKITQISDRRIGVTVANNRIWQKSRERA
jgi:hypothetical protein